MVMRQIPNNVNVCKCACGLLKIEFVTQKFFLKTFLEILKQYWLLSFKANGSNMKSWQV